MDFAPKWRASFRISHPFCDPARITNALCLIPEIVRSAGAPRATPAGLPLDGHWKVTHWIRTFAEGRGPDDLEDNLLDFTKSLVPFRPFLEELVDTGGRMNYFVGWFPDHNSGMSLSPELLRMMGELRIELQLDLYAPELAQIQSTPSEFA